MTSAKPYQLALDTRIQAALERPCGACGVTDWSGPVLLRILYPNTPRDDRTRHMLCFTCNLCGDIARIEALNYQPPTPRQPPPPTFLQRHPRFFVDVLMFALLAGLAAYVFMHRWGV